VVLIVVAKSVSYDKAILVGNGHTSVPPAAGRAPGPPGSRRGIAPLEPRSAGWLGSCLRPAARQEGIYPLQPGSLARW